MGTEGVRFIGALLAAALLPAAATAQVSRVFVSSQSVMGDVGVAGADTLCNDLAATAGLGGTWVAWLSSSAGPAVGRLTPGSGPFVRATAPATVIATGLADLTDGSLANPVLLDETGAPVPGDVWTGTGPDGTASLLFGTCADWTSAAIGSQGAFGLGGDATALWTEAGGGSCNQLQPVYCFERLEVPIPALAPAGILLLSLLLAAGGVLLLRRP